MISLISRSRNTFCSRDANKRTPSQKPKRSWNEKVCQRDYKTIIMRQTNKDTRYVSMERSLGEDGYGGETETETTPRISTCVRNHIASQTNTPLSLSDYLRGDLLHTTIIYFQSSFSSFQLAYNFRCNNRKTKTNYILYKR